MGGEGLGSRSYHQKDVFADNGRFRVPHRLKTHIPKSCVCHLFFFSFAFPILHPSLSLFLQNIHIHTIIMSSLRFATHYTIRARFYSTATSSRLAAVTTENAAKASTAPALSAAALHASGPLRNDWTRQEIQAIYDSPFMDLMFYGVSIQS